MHAPDDSISAPGHASTTQQSTSAYPRVVRTIHKESEFSEVGTNKPRFNLMDENQTQGINVLLRTLSIPITLASTQELTPTLLIAILESTLRQRLPLTPQARACTTRRGRLEAMKVFLGVLLDDLLVLDVDVDPQRLADGMPEETTLVARLLYLLADTMELGIHLDGSSAAISIAPSEAGESTRLYMLEDISYDINETGTIPFDLQLTTAGSHRDSFEHSSVRYDGWIDNVNEQEELEAFEASRSFSYYLREDTVNPAPIEVCATFTCVNLLV